MLTMEARILRAMTMSWTLVRSQSSLSLMRVVSSRMVYDDDILMVDSDEGD